MAEKPRANKPDQSITTRDAYGRAGDPGNADHGKKHAPTYKKSGGTEEMNHPRAGGQGNPQVGGIGPPDRLEKEKPVVEEPREGNGWTCAREGERESGNTTRQPHQGRRTTGRTSDLKKKHVRHMQEYT